MKQCQDLQFRLQLLNQMEIFVTVFVNHPMCVKHDIACAAFHMNPSQPFSWLERVIDPQRIMAASSPGCDQTPDVPTDQEAEISYLTVGFWRRSAKPGPLSFFVLHSSQTFVLLSEEPWKGQQVCSAPWRKGFY